MLAEVGSGGEDGSGLGEVGRASVDAEGGTSVDALVGTVGLVGSGGGDVGRVGVGRVDEAVEGCGRFVDDDTTTATELEGWRLAAEELWVRMGVETPMEADGLATLAGADADADDVTARAGEDIGEGKCALDVDVGKGALLAVKTAALDVVCRAVAEV